MFAIRDEQVDIFKEVAFRKFEDEMVEHVKAFFPNHYNAMQEKNVRNTIRYGYTRAKTYGFLTIRNVCLYLNNMLLLGSNFDTDPQYPWAKEILTDTNEQDPIVKIDKLSDKTLAQLSKVTGPSNIFIYRAILNFTKNSDEIFQKLTGSYLSRALHHLKLLFNQKYEVVGEFNLNEMIRNGLRNAPQYGFTDESNMLVYIVFMFMMGSGFDKDPQFPWINEILNDRAITNQNKKMETLYQTTIGNLRSALSKYSH